MRTDADLLALGRQFQRDSLSQDGARRLAQEHGFVAYEIAVVLEGYQAAIDESRERARPCKWGGCNGSGPRGGRCSRCGFVLS